MKENKFKKLVEKIKNNFNFNGNYAVESNVCIKVFNGEEGQNILPSMEKIKNINRSKKAVNFFEIENILNKNLQEREMMLYDLTNKILENKNIF